MATKKLARLTVSLYWGTLVYGLLMPWAVTIWHDASKQHGEWAVVWRDFRLHLFAPGYNLFLIGLLNVAPFVLLAVFLLLHLGTAASQDAVIVNRRLAGAAGALLVAVGLSTWVHVEVLIHPDAQGALAYFFLPIYLLGLIPIGYALGRLAGRFLFAQPAPPPATP
jgi:hypothetical protein